MRFWYVALTFISVMAAAPAGSDAEFKLLDIDGHLVKWGAAKLGDGATVRWRIAFDSGTGAGRENCKRTDGFDRVLAKSRLKRDDAVEAATAAFALWSKVANIRFVAAAPGESADITIAAEADPDGIAYADVTPLPAEARITSLSRAVVCLNPDAGWTNAATGRYRLAYVLAHEIGHTLGLDHPGPNGTLMSFEYDAERRTLAAGDIAGIVALYGPAAKIVSTR